MCSWRDKGCSDNSHPCRRQLPWSCSPIRIGKKYNLLCFDEVIGWIMKTLQFPLVSILHKKKWTVLHELAQHFAEKSGHCFYGTFGSLDGLEVHIASPWLKDIPDPCNFHCKKLLCIECSSNCDKLKRFLWVSPMSEWGFVAWLQCFCQHQID